MEGPSWYSFVHEDIHRSCRDSLLFDLPDIFLLLYLTRQHQHLESKQVELYKLSNLPTQERLDYSLKRADTP